MNFIERTISVVCQVLLWISTVIIFVILAANTILRYATGASLQWANEVPELLFPWMVMAGVVLAAQHGAHITTSFLMDKLSGSVRRLWGVLGWSVVSVLYATLAVATWRMLDIVHDEKSPRANTASKAMPVMTQPYVTEPGICKMGDFSSCTMSSMRHVATARNSGFCHVWLCHDRHGLARCVGPGVCLARLASRPPHPALHRACTGSLVRRT